MTGVTPDLDSYTTRAANRIGWLTLMLGLAGALVVLVCGSRRSSLGIATGALLAWTNYVWLKQGVEALARAAIAQESSPQPRVPARVYFEFAGRFVLIGLIVYLSVSHFGVPLLAIICGLLALGAAAIAEGIYEVIGSWGCTNT